MADPKITSNRGWAQLKDTLGRKAPQRLHAAQRARQGLLNLTKGKAG